jgi:probable phosphoglycerate mutase
VLEADGGSRGNPGPAGFGAVLLDAETGEVLAERAGGIGRATNNVAEYRGLIAGLQAAQELAPTEVEVRMDSKLVIEQMAGRWRVRHPDLASLNAEASALAGSLPSVRFTWVPREANRHADRLANEAMDAAAAGRDWVRRTGGADEPRRAAPPAAAAAPAGPDTVDTDRTDSLPATTAGRSTVDSPPGDQATRDQAIRERAIGERAGLGEADAAGSARARGWGEPTTAACSFLLLRHGETRHSPELRFSGRGDLRLTERGVAQAQAAARRLAAMAAARGDVAAVLTSPLARARATADVVGTALGLRPVTDDDLVETDFGVWEGLTFAEVGQRYPGELAEWLRSPRFAPPGGESFATVAARVRRARDRLVAAYPSRAVVVVSHVTPIKILVCLALDAPPSALFRLHLDIGGLSIVDWHPDGPATVRLVNDTSHLTG